jgi:hypothetical protein
MSSAEALRLRGGAWRARAAAWLALARLSNAPTVVSNVLAGAALATAVPAAGTVALLAAGLVLFYAGGMVLNDLCDLAVDRRERPGRPLVRGLVAPRQAAAATVALFAAGLVLLLAAGTAPAAWGLVLLALIMLYDRWHKGNPLSPLLMAGTRALVYVIGFAAFAGGLPAELLVAAGLLFAYVVGLTQIAKAEAGGALARHWPAVLVLLPLAWYGWQAADPAVAAALVLFAAWTLYAASFAYRRGDVGGAVGRLVAGISLYDALVLAAAGAPAVLVGLAVAAFAATVTLQRRIAGT